MAHTLGAEPTAIAPRSGNAVRPPHPSAIVLPCSLLTIRWFPSLGVLLAVSGSLVFLAGMMETPSMLVPPLAAAQPDPPSHPVEIPSEEPDQAAVAPFDVRQDVVRVPGKPFLIAVGDLPADGTRTGVASGCLETDLGRGTRSESAHLATLPLRRDPREALMTLAAARHGGPGSWSGPCLMRRLAIPDRSRTDSDDRIATALFASAPRKDARWDLIEMASGQRGDWTRQCPCPVYAIANPGGAPR